MKSAKQKNVVVFPRENVHRPKVVWQDHNLFGLEQPVSRCLPVASHESWLGPQLTCKLMPLLLLSLLHITL